MLQRQRRARARVVGWVAAPAAALSRSGCRAAGAWSPARARARAAGQSEQLRQHQHLLLVRHPLPVSQQPQRRPRPSVWRCGAGEAGSSSRGGFGSPLSLGASSLSASSASTPPACSRWQCVAAAACQRAAAAAHSRGGESCALMAVILCEVDTWLLDPVLSLVLRWEVDRCPSGQGGGVSLAFESPSRQRASARSDIPATSQRHPSEISESLSRGALGGAPFLRALF